MEGREKGRVDLCIFKNSTELLAKKFTHHEVTLLCVCVYSIENKKTTYQGRYS